MKNLDIELEFDLPVNPEQAFALLTDQEQMADWGAGEGLVEPRVNGKFAMFDGWVSGKVLNFVPGKTLSYTWRPSTWEELVPDTTVSYRFSPSPTGTHIALKHTGFPNKQERDSHETGWNDHVFGPITEFLESN